jgi:hypothetical protein
MNLTERVKYLTATLTPGLPVPQTMCSFALVRALPDGKYEYRCSQCGGVRIVDEMLGATRRVCRG